MAKRGSKSSKLAAQGGKPSAPAAETTSADRAGKHSKISDELRQAVQALGGDEEDLDLIEGVDDDEEDSPATKSTKPKGKEPSSDEKSLRKALGDFMKGLDFGSVPAPVIDDDDSAEEVSDAESEDDEDEDDEDDDEEDEEEAESDDEDEDEEQGPSEDSDESEEEEERTAVVPPSKQAEVPQSKTKDPVQPLDRDMTSGKIVPPSPSWSALAPPLSPPAAPLEPLQPFRLAGLRNKATNLLDNLPALNRASSSSDTAFISQILQSGTHQDKLSALILLVRESPIHAVKELSRLRSMTGWKEDGTFGGGGNKDQRVAVMKALADWWVTGGGKEAGKLKYFADQPMLAHPDLTDRHLLVFAFEDWLKRWFFNLLQVLEVLLHDTLPFIKTQALHITFRLLSGNAEQEQNLLRLGVNKLGDNDKSIASKTSHHILQLLQAHPAMKAVVAREVSALVLKPPTVSAEPSSSHVRFDDKPAAAPAKAEGVSHARYYGLITLNQITLTSHESDTAGRLVELYFEIFREILGDGKVEEEAQDHVEKVAGKVEKWRGRRKGSKPKGGRKSALEDEELIDASEARLVAAVLTGINRAMPYAKLDEEIFAKHMDTLFKITHKGTFNTSIQSLQLIAQVARSRPAIADRFYRTLYDSLFDPRLVTSSKQAMYLNLVFRTLKVDESLTRVMAFVKRLLQMLGMQQPPFICGALYLLGELFASTPGLKRMLIEPEDDGEEHFVDADRPQKSVPEASSSTHANAYDGRKRDPKFAHADASCLWELTPFLDHFHPSVSLQAQQLLRSEPLTGSADISLNSLVSFLDRFVYRNPKKNLQPKGASIMQPAAVYDRTGMLVSNKGARTGEDTYVNSEKFWRKKIEDVPVDQMFFHKFFAGKLAQKEAAAKKKKKGGVSSDEEDDVVSDKGEDVSDDESEADDVASVDEPASEDESDPEEAEIWKAMQATMPDAGDDMDLSSDDMDSDEGDYSDSEEEDVEGGEGDASVEDEAEETSDEDADEPESESESESEPAAAVKKGKGKQKAEPDSDSDFPDLADEDDDLLSESEMPDIVLGTTPSPEPEEEVATGKRKRKDERKERKRKRRELPTFGSYEDYAAMIEAAGNDGED
ncbi:putative ribosome biogenesis protein [Papiliotrema laurentii]|uniref:Ribosome biogenesis protein n=1 Tax=Papiliotrema laurentii TaxID=5418 RepID=A0AAD9FQ10_PAPLA|nr:putative ribosome biogenesis protein [Papiliotrema laurentii]